MLESRSERPLAAVPSRDERRELFSADCGSCFGLCCVALSFTRSADFAASKDAGDPCVNLDDDFSCSIHDRLRPSGYKGCTVFDCFGAGQKVAQGTFGGRSWVEAPATRDAMFAIFPKLRELDELLWYLGEALELPVSAALMGEVVRGFESTRFLSDADTAALATLDVGRHRDGLVDLLRRVSAEVRAGSETAELDAKSARRIRAGTDLVGADLRRRDLRGVDLRGSYLIAADLAGADLRWADLIGTDLRDADLSGADLSTAIFVTQPQIASARGDAPRHFRRRWPAPLTGADAPPCPAVCRLNPRKRPSRRS